jgi:hypothetical protein
MFRAVSAETSSDRGVMLCFVLFLVAVAMAFLGLSAGWKLGIFQF